MFALSVVEHLVDYRNLGSNCSPAAGSLLQGSTRTLALCIILFCGIGTIINVGSYLWQVFDIHFYEAWENEAVDQGKFVVLIKKYMAQGLTNDFAEGFEENAGTLQLSYYGSSVITLLIFILLLHCAIVGIRTRNMAMLR